MQSPRTSHSFSLRPNPRHTAALVASAAFTFSAPWRSLRVFDACELPGRPHPRRRGRLLPEHIFVCGHCVHKPLSAFRLVFIFLILHTTLHRTSTAVNYNKEPNGGCRLVYRFSITRLIALLFSSALQCRRARHLCSL